MFLESGRAIATQIQTLIDQEVNQPLRFAVAYWGAGADFKLRGASRIICDLSSGLCNPIVIRSMLERDNVVVLQLDSLHAKIVVGSDGAVVSSANMSSNGLGAEGSDASGTIEAGCFVQAGTADHQRISAWFEEQWELARNISTDDLARAAWRWEHRKGDISPLPTIGSLPATELAIDPYILLESHIDSKDRLAAVRPHIFNLLKDTLPALDHRRMGKIATWACHLLLNQAGLTQQYGPGDSEGSGSADDAWLYSRFGTTKRSETRASVAALLATISRSTYFSRNIRRAAAQAIVAMGLKDTL